MEIARKAYEWICGEYGYDVSGWPVDAGVVLARMGEADATGNRAANRAAAGPGAGDGDGAIRWGRLTPQWLNAAMRLCGIAHRFRYRHKVECRVEPWLERELVAFIRAVLVRNPDSSAWLTDLDQHAEKAMVGRFGHKAIGVPYSLALGVLLREIGFELRRGARGMRICCARLKV